MILNNRNLTIILGRGDVSEGKKSVLTIMNEYELLAVFTQQNKW